MYTNSTVYELLQQQTIAGMAICTGLILMMIRLCAQILMALNKLPC